jgi:hypothetical protein
MSDTKLSDEMRLEVCVAKSYGEVLNFQMLDDWTERVSALEAEVEGLKELALCLYYSFDLRKRDEVRTVFLGNELQPIMDALLPKITCPFCGWGDVDATWYENKPGSKCYYTCPKCNEDPRGGP